MGVDAARSWNRDGQTLDTSFSFCQRSALMPDDVTPKDILRLGLEKQSRDELGEALKLYEMIGADSNLYALSLQLQGAIHLKLRRRDIGVELLQKSLLIDGNNFETHMNLGEAYLQAKADPLTGRSPALRHFRKALALRPHDGLARIGLEYAHTMSTSKAHWCRIVMYEEAIKLMNELPADLNVMEISGQMWRDAPLSWKSYEATSYPQYDVCKGQLEKSYDLVILDQVLEHVKYPDLALENVRGSLQPGGACFVSTPFMIRLHPAPLDLWRWSAEGLKIMLTSAGFPEEKIQIGSWGNRDCLIANLTRWEVYDPISHSLANEPDFPVTVWALARL